MTHGYGYRTQILKLKIKRTERLQLNLKLNSKLVDCYHFDRLYYFNITILL